MDQLTHKIAYLTFHLETRLVRNVLNNFFFQRISVAAHFQECETLHQTL